MREPRALSWTDMKQAEMDLKRTRGGVTTDRFALHRCSWLSQSQS